jgi:hypothetical protein
MLKRLLTNWVHLLGFYIGVEICTIINMVLHPDAGNSWKTTIITLLLSAPFLMFTYGVIIIAGFILAIILLDIILFSLVEHNALLVMFIEWILIVPIFIYWAFEYKYWLWIALSVTFLITQFIKSKKIDKLLANR